MSAPTPTPMGGKTMLVLVTVALLVSLGALGFTLVKATSPARTPVIRPFSSMTPSAVHPRRSSAPNPSACRRRISS